MQTFITSFTHFSWEDWKGPCSGPEILGDCLRIRHSNLIIRAWVSSSDTNSRAWPWFLSSYADPIYIPRVRLEVELDLRHLYWPYYKICRGKYARATIYSDFSSRYRIYRLLYGCLIESEMCSPLARINDGIRTWVREKVTWWEGCDIKPREVPSKSSLRYFRQTPFLRGSFFWDRALSHFTRSDPGVNRWSRMISPDKIVVEDEYGRHLSTDPVIALFDFKLELGH